ncbi:hypothetical protein B7P43_G15284 [Cryptotermes secundus]|uniref:XLR/SYCP3/FAM9 domain-containing protein n=3 Tax=Cryptotermes secundus TaxID=105785 RepID=A0A2J7PBJ0_9NEOP|nr:hypothetical protein B7P43_G15284 [Cryptotermes secundus]
MPKASSKKVKIMQETEEFISSPELCEDEFPMKNGAKSLMKSNRISKYETDTKSGGTYCAVANNTNTDLGNDLRKVLDMFGADVNKALRAKKQQLEQYSAGAMKANETRIKEMLQCQSEARMHHHEEMCRNVNSVLEQWNVDLAHSKDNEEKMIKIVQKQIKIIQQNRTSQLQRLAYLRQIHESYQKNFLQEEAKQNDQCLSMLQELRRELNELQKKMVVDNQKVEVAQMQEALKRSVSFI